MKTKFLSMALVLLLGTVLAGCNAASNGNKDTCTAIIGVDPPTAQADHAAVPPANQATFVASNEFTGPMCPKTPTQLGDVDATWTTSDPVNTTIVPVKTSVGTSGLATCVNATAAPVTITATSPAGLKATATLTCK